MENCLTRFDVLMSLNVNMHDDHWSDLSACIVIDEVSLEIKEILERENFFFEMELMFPVQLIGREAVEEVKSTVWGLSLLICEIFSTL